jgi:hypothetical protein
MRYDSSAADKRLAILHDLVASVQHGEQRDYHIGVVGYYIKGIPYPATGIRVTVGPTCESRLEFSTALALDLVAPFVMH